VRGFKRAVRSGVTLQVDQKAVVDFSLQIGAVAEQVEVVGEAALALTLLTPGVRGNAASSSGFGDRGVEVTSVSIDNGPTAMNGQVLDGGLQLAGLSAASERRSRSSANSKSGGAPHPNNRRSV
jgi:hypothetical protein